MTTSTVAGTLNASPMAEAAIDPERTVASASAPSSSSSPPDAGEATSRSTSSGSRFSSEGSSGACRGVAFEEVLQLGPDLERRGVWRGHDGFSRA